MAWLKGVMRIKFASVATKARVALKWLGTILTILLYCAPSLIAGTSSIELVERSRWASGESVRTVQISGDLMYVLFDDQLEIVDLSDPRQPRLAGAVNNLADAAVSGSYAIVAAGLDGLRIVDITDPARPTKIGEWANGKDAIQRVIVSGNHAYAASTNGETSQMYLLIYEIIDPAAPKLVSRREIDGYDRTFRLFGNQLTVAGYDWGADRVFDVSSPENPQPGDLMGHGIPWMAVSGRYGYTAGWNWNNDTGVWWNGFQIFDISSPEAPAEMGFTLMPWHFTYSEPLTMFVSGRYVYVTDLLFDVDVTTGAIPDGYAWEIVDINDPAHPMIAASGENARPLAVAGSLVIMNPPLGLRIMERVVRPELRMKYTAQMLEISWVGGPGFKLQTRSSLNQNTSWNAVDEAPELFDGKYVVRLAGAEAGYFRLVLP
jgi:hypothetical protein